MSAPASAMQQLMSENTPPPPPAANQDQPAPIPAAESLAQPQIPQPKPTKVVASAPVNQPPQNDVDGTYMAHRDSLEGRAAMQSLMSESGGAQPQETKPGEKPKGEEGAAPTLGLGEAIAGVKAYGPVLKDVGLGLTEAPRQIVEGSRNAFQSMLDGIHSFNQWIGEKTGVGEYVIGKGYESAEQYAHEPGAKLPDFGQAKTVTGGVISAASQFITSMYTLGKVFGPMGTEAEGALGHLATLGKSGAAIFAGFHKAEGNVADLIEQVPSLSNPVTRFLQSDPSDNEAAGRLRNALAGVGFGELQQGLLHGLTALRAGLAVEKGGLPGPKTATGQPVETPAAFKFLGDPNATPDQPLAEIREAPRETLEAGKAERAQAATEGLTPEIVGSMGEPARAVAGPRVPGAQEALAKEPQVYINFARIDTPDDVKRTMSQLADAQQDNIAVARRGIQTFEQTKLGAEFEDAWKTLMERRIGEPLNASQQLAGRQLLAQSAMKTSALTDMALANPQDLETVFAWRKQMQTHAMIQAEVSGSQAEIARSLGAMRIPVEGQGAIDRMGALTQQLDGMGGLKSNLDFLQATKVLMDSGRLEDLGNVAEKTAYAKTRDALITGWTNGLLTNPLTHVKVNLSNIATIGLRLAETRFAEGMDQLTSHDGIPAGEAAQTTQGLISGIKDSFRYIASLAKLAEPPEGSPVQDAATAFRTGHYTVGTQDPDWMIHGQSSADALSIADSSWMGKATDLASSLVTSPGRALAGEHEFYRSIGMRMELNRFAYRQAMDELNSGTIKPNQLAGRIAELVEKPPPGLNTAAVDGMTYQTFTDAPGKLAEAMEKIRNDFPLSRVIIPFYKIPSRILSFTFERTPLAPLMAGWRADIAAGGARQSMALAKTGMGSMVMLAATDAVLNGQITGEGPKDKAQRQALMDTGWLPYSVKTPSGRWVQYNRLETVGSSIAMAADATETIRDYFSNVNKDDPNVETLTGALVASLANNVTSKTYFEGIARFFDTISDPKANARSMMKSLAGSVVPAGVGALASAMDPYQRATYSMMDAIKAKTPGVSKDLPPVMNLWGEPVRHDSGLGKAYDAFVPFASRRPGNEPIDKEMLAQGFHLSAPSARTSMGDGAVVDLSHDPQAYARYQQLAGNELKLPGPNGEKGLKDRLNDIVTGNDALSSLYDMRSDGPDGGKYLMLRGISEEYRRAAREQLLGENGPLKEKVAQAQERHRELRQLTMSAQK